MKSVHLDKGGKGEEGRGRERLNVDGMMMVVVARASGTNSSVGQSPGISHITFLLRKKAGKEPRGRQGKGLRRRRWLGKGVDANDQRGGIFIEFPLSRLASSSALSQGAEGAKERGEGGKLWRGLVTLPSLSSASLTTNSDRPSSLNTLPSINAHTTNARISEDRGVQRVGRAPCISSGMRGGRGWEKEGRAARAAAAERVGRRRTDAKSL